jgi:uncharacterized protein (DUF2461 family)
MVCLFEDKHTIYKRLLLFHQGEENKWHLRNSDLFHQEFN